MDISPELMNTDQPEALKKPTQVGERVHHDDRSFVPKSLAEGKEVANHARTKHTITPTNSDLVVVFEKWENNERKWWSTFGSREDWTLKFVPEQGQAGINFAVQNLNGIFRILRISNDELYSPDEQYCEACV